MVPAGLLAITWAARLRTYRENLIKGETMQIKRMGESFSICKVEDYSDTDLTSEFVFVGKTDEENSLVCLTRAVPRNVTNRDDGWRAMRIQGVLDFSLVGILSGISAVLAAEGIGIFAISTFNTDYVLVREADYEAALAVLAGAGHQVVG